MKKPPPMRRTTGMGRPERRTTKTTCGYTASHRLLAKPAKSNQGDEVRSPEIHDLNAFSAHLHLEQGRPCHQNAHPTHPQRVDPVYRLCGDGSEEGETRSGGTPDGDDGGS